MLTLYGSGQSRSLRVVWALEEAGLEYNYQPVKLGTKPSAEYFALNPQGKVPTLVDDNGEVPLVLNESAAAVSYIATLAPEKALIPTDAKARAYYDEICFFILSDLEQPLWSNGKHRFVLPEEHRIPKMLETATWEFKRSLKALKHHMADKQYIVNNEFSMADVLLVQTLLWAKAFKFELPEFTHDYIERVSQREAFKRALAAVE